MRAFTDTAGRRWDVVAGRESWGSLVALFVPAGWKGEILQTPLQAAGYEVAEQELDRLDEDELQRMLDGAKPKEG
jgi:hypothetical protein